MKVRVVKASEIAKLIAQPQEGDKTALIFGKIFEECYTYATYLHEEGFRLHNSTNKNFVKKIVAELKAHNIRLQNA